MRDQKFLLIDDACERQSPRSCEDLMAPEVDWLIWCDLHTSFQTCNDSENMKDSTIHMYTLHLPSYSVCFVAILPGSSDHSSVVRRKVRKAVRRLVRAKNCSALTMLQDELFAFSVSANELAARNSVV